MNKVRGYLLIGFFLLTLLSGCSSNGNAEASTIPNLGGGRQRTPTMTRTPTETATSLYTATITATATATATETATATPMATPTPKPPPFFDTFVASLVNGNASQVVGVYVENVLALKVVQQPASNPGYVSTQNGVATYFLMAYQMTGNTGLLAHNYLAGIYYYDLVPGQVVVLIYGDGSTEDYIVSGNQEYQALSPNSATSNFVDLATGETLTSTQLFYAVYGGSLRTTFQTCIAQGGEPSWGRLFVIAPLE